MAESQLLDGARLADIRKRALPGSDVAFLLARIDRLTALLEQARAEARTLHAESSTT